ncbi:hypothetical protein TWF696_006726 [Orbilia brochopaga]|uniref:Uncharacterized protein n=1 Tax=Orbilia brochopaga TaxID=3140254 RepID=A0AAV9US85_9PEZI
MLNKYRNGLRDSFISEIYIQMNKLAIDLDDDDPGHSAFISVELEIPRQELGSEQEEMPVDMQRRYYLYWEPLRPELEGSTYSIDGSEAQGDIVIHPAYEALRGTTYNNQADATEPPPPSYQYFGTGCTTATGLHKLLKFAASGEEGHLVVFNAPAETDPEFDTSILGKALYEIWQFQEGIHRILEDLTFMQVTERTKRIIQDVSDKRNLRENDILVLNWLDEDDREDTRSFLIAREVSAVLGLLPLQSTDSIISTLEVTYHKSGERKGEPVLLIRLRASPLLEDDGQNRISFTLWTRTIKDGIGLYLWMNAAATKYEVSGATKQAFSQDLREIAQQYGISNDGKKSISNPAVQLIESAMATEMTMQLASSLETNGFFSPTESPVMLGSSFKISDSLTLLTFPQKNHIVILRNVVKSYPKARQREDIILHLRDVLYTTWGAETGWISGGGSNMFRYFSILGASSETRAVVTEIFRQKNLGYDDSLWLEADHSIIGNLEGTDNNPDTSRWLAMLGTFEASIVEEMNIQYSQPKQRITGIFIRWTGDAPWLPDEISINQQKQPELLIVCLPYIVKSPGLASASRLPDIQTDILGQSIHMGSKLRLEEHILTGMGADTDGENELYPIANKKLQVIELENGLQLTEDQDT